MRSSLAEKLMTRIMEWTPDQIDFERPLLQAMANLKWNEYQQFSPGTRFIESLVKWLQQFNNLKDKLTAYRLVKEHLIFISNEQIAHLVDILFSEKINPQLIQKTAKEIEEYPYLVSKILAAAEYKRNLRTSLFVGLSDGSKIDQFRRAAKLNNEQVIATYEISSSKVKDMMANLHKDYANSTFETIFLIDDFTASGKTFFRNEGEGKLGKILNSIFFDKSGGFNPAVNTPKIEVHVLFYIATTDALKNIKEGIESWKKKHSIEIFATVDCLLTIDDTEKRRILADKEVMELLKKYFDPDVIDSHFEEGRHDLPFLGFNECGLPLVLNHNTPNNSLAILWMPTDKKFKGLFPRISRHREK